MKKYHFLALYIISILSTPLLLRAEMLKIASDELAARPLIKTLAEDYESKHSSSLNLSVLSSTGAIRGVSAGIFDIAFSSRERHINEEGLIHPEEERVKFITVAWIPLSVIVNKANPVESISSRGLKKILNGQITQWKDFGGPEKEIILCLVNTPLSSVNYLSKLILFNNPNHPLKSRYLHFKNSLQVQEKVASSKYAIGFSGTLSLPDTVKSLSIDSSTPSKRNIEMLNYPLFAPIYLIVNRDISSKVESFLTYVVGEEGQALVIKHGGVSLLESKKLKQEWG